MGTIDRLQYFDKEPFHNQLSNFAKASFNSKEVKRIPRGLTREINIDPQPLLGMSKNNEYGAPLLRTVFEHFTRVRQISLRFNDPASTSGNRPESDPRQSPNTHVIQVIMPHLEGRPYSVVNVSLILRAKQAPQVAKYVLDPKTKKEVLYGDLQNGRFIPDIHMASAEELYAFSLLLGKLELL